MGVNMKWTTEKPTVKGFYWLTYGGVNAPQVVEVYSNGRELLIAHTNGRHPREVAGLDKYHRWYGPLAPPKFDEPLL